MIAQVRSGGQTGVDEAALRAAKRESVPTGGVMPKGFKTLAGSRPDFAALYGMVEDDRADYGSRTRKNIEATDCTIRIAAVWSSPGEVLTLKHCMRTGKTPYDITLKRGAPSGGRPTYIVDEAQIHGAVDFIQFHAQRLGRPVALNVAGNSNTTAPGIGEVAEGVMKMILDAVCGG